MKSESRKSRKKRIILLYSLAVVLPGLVLGYMAFRGILNDQAIREKESRNRLESVREDFFSELDSALYTGFQNSFGEAVQIKNSKKDKAVLASLVIHPNADPTLISHNLLYLPGEFLPSLPPKAPSSYPKLEEAQKMEFGAGQLREALFLYQSLENKDSNTQLELQSLVGQARILGKLNREQEAKEIYQLIIKDYSDYYVGTRIPAKSMALLELAKMQAESRITKKQRNFCLEILNSLINPQKIYGANHYAFMYRSVKELVLETDTVCNSLLKLLDKQAEQTELVNEMISNTNLIFSNRNMHIIPLGTGLFMRPLYYNNLVALSADSQDPQNSGQMLLILDLKTKILSLAKNLISKTDPDGLLNWRFRETGAEAFFQFSTGEPDFMSYEFPDGYPNWTLSLFEDQPGLIASLLAPERGVFLLVFVFITVMLIFGLFFTLNTLNQEIRLNSLKSEFISNVSHELKSPLTSIRQRAELLTQKRVHGRQKPQYYSTILDQSEQLSHLIENILDFSRIEDERKKYQFEEINMLPFLRKIVDSFNQRQIGSQTVIMFIAEKETPKISIDPNAMQQVIYNLLDNSCKFSGEVKKIEVGIKNHDSKVRSHGKTDSQDFGGNWVSIWVKDWGFGISKKDKERIFERFYRAEEGRILGIKGSGIGLTLVKRIVEAHSGQIKVESEAGKGSTFWINLPIRQ